MATECALPNLLRCIGKECLHTMPMTVKRREQLPLRCPKCGNSLTVRCGSRLRNPSPGREHPCFVFVRPGMRCKLHGGKALKGPASPSWKTGATSRYVPGRYKPAFQRGMADPLAQREMRVQLALMEGLQEEALKRLDTGESGEAWAILQSHGVTMRGKLRAIKVAGQGGDSAKAGELAQQLLTMIEEQVLPAIETGAKEEDARMELVQLFTKRARLIRVQQQGEKTVPVDVLAALQARFVSLMAKYIEDRATLARFVAELREEALPGWTEAAARPAKVTKMLDE